MLHNERCVDSTVDVDAEFRHGISGGNDLASCQTLSQL
jgi:hypothetical protein